MPLLLASPLSSSTSPGVPSGSSSSCHAPISGPGPGVYLCLIVDYQLHDNWIFTLCCNYWCQYSIVTSHKIPVIDHRTEYESICCHAAYRSLTELIIAIC